MSREAHASWRRWLVLLACALPLGALTGCGPKELPRVAVEGRVTLDGQPLPAGSIVFVPLRGTAGPKAGGTIANGKYKLTEEVGPMIGSLRVEIRAEDPQRTGPAVDDPQFFAEAVGSETTVNAVPAVYNDDSTLVVDTTAGVPNTFDFDLQSEPPR